MVVLEEQLKQQEEASKFAMQVCGLAKTFSASRPACDPALDALEEEEVVVGGDLVEMQKEKSKKKKRKSKGKA